ncbi:MAG: acylneuraminate cytidylyltransferase family protein [Actinomycetales bacterium]|nr:acylneuraminate cytidylyltransferase family protein [Actinomycetales bacterium]
MFDNNLVIAFIPARGGSKGLPGKNLMTIAGKNMIERAATSATDWPGGSKVDVTVVSSDDEAILAAAKAAGCVTHERSAFAASDEATAADVIRDYFQSPEVMLEGDPWIVYLQPTSPARTGAHVAAAFGLIEAGARAAVSVTTPEKSPYWTLNVNEQGELTPLFPQAFESNRQSLAAAYIPNGAVYIFKLSDFLAAGAVPVQNAAAFIMSREESVDIDTQEDFDKAKALLER